MLEKREPREPWPCGQDGVGGGSPQTAGHSGINGELEQAFGLAEKVRPTKVVIVERVVEEDIQDLPNPSPALRELELEDPELRVPNRATAEKVWAEIPCLKLGLFILRGEMGFRPTEARRLDVRNLVLGSESDLSDAYIYLPGSKEQDEERTKATTT